VAEAPTYVASSLLEYASRKVLELAKPAGSKKGDLLCVYPYAEVNGKAFSVSGLTATNITAQKQVSTSWRIGALWVEHDGTESKIKVVWEGEAAANCVLAIDAWRGVDMTNPIDVTAALTEFTGKTFTAPTIKTVTANTVQVVMEVNGAGTGLKTPTGFTARTSYSPGTVSRVREAAGETGTTACELEATATPGVMVTFALRPASSGKTLKLEWSDSVSVSETYGKGDAKVVTDAVAVTDAVSKKVTKTIAESVSAADQLTKRPTKALADSVTVSDALTKKLARTITDAVTLVEAWVLNLVKGEPETPVATGTMRVREPVPMRQYLLATTPSHKTYRWGEDERDGERVFEDLTDSDSVPGGCRDLNVSLPRRQDIDYADLEAGTRLELRGVGGRPIWEGELQEAPRTSGDRLVISPAAVGYQNDLSLDESAQCIPIDADMSAWGEPSAAFRVFAEAYAINQNAQVALLPAGDPAGGGVPAISHAWSRINSTGAKPSTRDIGQSWYDGGGVEPGRVMLDFVNVKGGGGGSWVTAIIASVNDVAGGDVVLKDFNATTTPAASIGVPAGKFFLRLESYLNANKSEDGGWEQQYRNIRVLDRSGLPVYGTWPNVGILFSDFLAYILPRWAPGIHFTTGAYGSIRPSRFPIPHMPFKEPTTVKNMIDTGNRFELNEWAVWPGQFGPTMYLNPRGEREGRKRWRARKGPSQYKDTGQSIARVYNAVLVEYEDMDGSKRILAPPGSGYRLTSEKCIDRDPLNPINQLGKKKWTKVAMKRKGTNLGAGEVAERFLEGCKLLDGSGEMTLTGWVEDEHGALWPYDRVRGGDLIDPLDGSGDHYIVSASRARSGRSSAIALDAPPDSFEALLERLDVEEVAEGL
jgi:hypothetical protein